MAVTLLPLYRDGAMLTDFGRIRTGGATQTGVADQQRIRSVGLSTAISGCCSLRPLTRKGWCTFLKWFMAVLHACFAVGCCFLAGRLIAAYFFDMECFFQPSEKRYLVSLIIRRGLGSSHSVHTAEVQRYLGWLFKSTFIGQSLRCVLSLNPCAAFHYTELTRVCHVSKILGQTVSAVSNLRELLI